MYFCNHALKGKQVGEIEDKLDIWRYSDCAGV